MTPNRIAAAVAAALLLAVGVIVARGVSEPAVTPPGPFPTEAPGPKSPWARADRVDHGDGLASAVLRPGSGRTPGAGDVVTVDLRGWLESTAVEITNERGAVAVLGDGSLVEGVQRALAMMKVGEIRQVRVPAALGYGQTGRPPRIPRDADLVFEVELRDAAPPRAPAEVPPDAETDQETDGVRWVRLAEGRGEPPAVGRKARVHVTTWLADGTRIDSTLTRHQPIAVTVGAAELYPGLDAAIAAMRPGERRKLIVPPALAAGPAGRGPIPPDSTLIFDVELVAVE